MPHYCVAMATLDDLTSSRHVALLDRSVLVRIADALGGAWQPGTEPQPDRRRALTDAAQLRLYADRQRSGWLLVTSSAARLGLADGPNVWCVGFIPPVESFDGAPSPTDVRAQASLFDDLDADAAQTLGLALLIPTITRVITTDVGRYKHQRPHDLPDRLRVVEVHDAVAQLAIGPGEAPYLEIPTSQGVAAHEPWWVPPT